VNAARPRARSGPSGEKVLKGRRLVMNKSSDPHKRPFKAHNSSSPAALNTHKKKGITFFFFFFFFFYII
jgi:hypothetical protein